MLTGLQEERSVTAALIARSRWARFTEPAFTRSLAAVFAFINQSSWELSVAQGDLAAPLSLFVSARRLIIMQQRDQRQQQ